MTRSLAFGICFQDLYSLSGLQQVDRAFVTFLKNVDVSLYHHLQTARHYRLPSATDSPINSITNSTLIMDLSFQVEEFLSQLFHIQLETQTLRKAHHSYSGLSEFKRHLIQKRIVQKFRDEKWPEGLASSFQQYIQLGDCDLIQAFFSAQERQDQQEKEQIERYIAWRCLSPEGKTLATTSSLFSLPQKKDYARLFDYIQQEGILYAPLETREYREGFQFIDSGPDCFYAFDQAYYCLKCHQTAKDSCAHGMRDQTGQLQRNPLHNILQGCPLGQKISEMNGVKEKGYALAALAIITLDNPMVAATGYRICNACEQACIFQKQTPVDVPAIETQILKEVLSLPWGFEIYSLLTRWNPLNFKQPLPLSASPYTVLVAGMGPAGFTLAHYLLRQGHHVVGIDGLKIEPLPPVLSGWTVDGRRVPFQPLRDIHDIIEPLDTRPAYGFGGVAEYGITARWDKNFLKIIRLILERHPRFRLFGHTRLGGNLTLKRAYELGFDHVALCLGAGKPQLLDLPQGYAKGVRAASDFLMSLQGNQTTHPDSLSTLQIRLPLVIIGGGLTAIDAATEALAWYPRQVEKFYRWYQELCSQYGRESIEHTWTTEEHEIAQEFLTHAQAFRHERAQAQQENRPPRFAALMTQWGGVTILYRKRLQDSPAYRLNAAEVQRALAQGVGFRENVLPEAVLTDAYGAINALQVITHHRSSLILNVRTLLIAIGTQANTQYAQEYPEELTMTEGFFQFQDNKAPFLANSISSFYVSAFGDLDPRFTGSVVKAMASAQQGYPLIDQHLRQQLPRTSEPGHLLTHLFEGLQSRLIERTPLGSQLIQLTIKAPLACSAYQPGQFFKLEGFESWRHLMQGDPLLAKGWALTPIRVDRRKGHLTFIVPQRSPAAGLFQSLPLGQPVALMGPTGSPSAIPEQKTVLIVAQGFHSLLLVPVMEAMEAAGSTLYVYMEKGHGQELFTSLTQNRWVTNILVNEKQLKVLLPHIDHILIMGTYLQMQTFQRTLQSLANLLKPDCEVIASLNSPMQCMMKGMCAQCIQRHVDPLTGESYIVYSCAQQDQPFQSLDMDMLKGRLEQNRLTEKVTRLWAAHKKLSTRTETSSVER
jgi:NADPH-dependent glutamate synthase beta subunit-like oxidoreductase/NAD(P)H-flavin reductase